MVSLKKKKKEDKLTSVIMAVGGDSLPRVAYVLAELDDMDGVFAPIKTASRVKYTCFDVSRHYLAFGTTSGGVVMLQLGSLAYLKTITVKEGPICQTALAPDESIIGFSTSRGITVVMEHYADRGAAQPQRLQVSYEHKGSMVTAMHWHVSSSKLFVGDDKGKVSVVNVSTSRTRNIFQVPTTMLMKLDSKVVQLDYAQDHLLVSTLTRCYLCDTTKEQYLQIGKKLRDGEYGACFYPGVRSVDPCTIFSARPGSRMWEVDIKGGVVCTHQFKSALAVKPEKLFSFRNEISLDDEETCEFPPQSVTFHRMLLLWAGSEDSPFILTWSPQAGFIFDPKKAQVVLWSEELKGIKDAKCRRSDAYILFTDGRFAKYSLMTAEHAVCRLYQHGLTVQGVQLILLKQASLCSARLNIHVPPHFLFDMLEKVSDLGKTYLFSNLSAVLGKLGLTSDKLSQSSRSSSAMSEPVRLGSGIYVVNKLPRDLDDDSQGTVCLTRWRSASPVFRPGSSSPHSSPSRVSDRFSPSPRRHRSSTPQNVSPKERVGKTISSTSSAARTPDSIDSGTSGGTSVVSDDTPSSSSSKDLPLKNKGEMPSRSTKVHDNQYRTWTSVCNQHNVDELKDSFRHKEDTLIINNDGPNGSLSRYKGDSLEDLTDHADYGSDKLFDSKKCNGIAHHSALDLSVPISLDLSDLSEESSSPHKKVSFENGSLMVSSVGTPSVKKSSETDVTEYDVQYKSPTTVGVKEMANEDMKDISWSAESGLYGDMYSTSLISDISYGSMSLYGSMTLPSMDMSFLFGPESSADLQNLKESISNKITSGKNLLLRNFRELELRLKQGSDSGELLDVKTKQDSSSAGQSEADVECSLSEGQEDKSFWSFLPPVDVSHLIEATKSTREKIRNPDILFDEDKLRGTLEEWLTHLHSAQGGVMTAINNFRHSNHSANTQSCRDDDTIKSTCSQGSSTSSSPSDNVDLSYRTEQDDTSLSEHKSCSEEKGEEVSGSVNIEVSESSTLKTESLHAKLLTPETIIFAYDPFRLNSDDHQMISELVLVCFQVRVWGKIRDLQAITIELKKEKLEISKHTLCNGNLDSEFAESPALVMHQDDVSKIAPNASTSSKCFSESKIIYSHYNGSSSNVQGVSVPPSVHDGSHLSELELREITDDDAQCAAFLRYYFHFLDIQRVRELLVLHKKPCVLTWNVMLEGTAVLNSKDEFSKKLATAQFELAADCLERGYSGVVLISHLLKIFKEIPARCVELCIHRSYHVTPLDVLYLSKSSYTYPDTFIQYISFMVDCLPDTQKPQVLEKLLCLDEVRWAWVYGLLQGGQASALKCSCGWPSPGAHCFPWKYCDLLLHIISSSENMYHKFLSVCFHLGFWKGHILLVKKLQLQDAQQKAVINLADKSLVSSDKCFGYLPCSEQDWKSLSHGVAKLTSVPGYLTCIVCGEKHQNKQMFPSELNDTVSWESSLDLESVGKAALKHLGPIKTLSLLQELETPFGTFSPQFYSFLLMSYMMDKQQSALTHRMLTTTGSYLWSRRPLSFSPEINQILQKEKQRQLSENKEAEKADDDCTARLGRCYLEEPEGHWGVHANLQDICKLCRMPLTSHLSSSLSGVTVCACGHTFHTVCLPEGFCVACVGIKHNKAT